MIFIETELKGAFIVEPERLEDERGFFARSWCKREFETHGLNPSLVQCNISFNRKKGTLRCTAGGIYDVIIDLRLGSPTFTQWISIELTEENRKMVFIPEGCAHGSLTLQDNSEVFYQMSEFYSPDCAKGVRWNDPVFGIQWPISVTVISEKDKHYLEFIPTAHTL